MLMSPSSTMSTFLADVRDTTHPERNSKHGPLPQLLLAMTLLTGLVDAFSFLVLGHVFVANITATSCSWGLPWSGCPVSRSWHQSWPWRRSGAVPSSVAKSARDWGAPRSVAQHCSLDPSCSSRLRSSSPP